MKRILLLGLLLSMFIFLLPGCDNEHSLKESYFNGKVLVEVKSMQSTFQGDNNISGITLVFYESGSYQFEFSLTPGTEGSARLPNNFSMLVEKVPTAYSSTQDPGDLRELLPAAVRVTVTHNGVSESHDFYPHRYYMLSKVLVCLLAAVIAGLSGYYIAYRFNRSSYAATDQSGDFGTPHGSLFIMLSGAFIGLIFFSLADHFRIFPDQTIGPAIVVSIMIGTLAGFSGSISGFKNRPRKGSQPSSENK